jgi:hypothetical protein
VWPFWPRLRGLEARDTTQNPSLTDPLQILSGFSAVFAFSAAKQARPVCLTRGVTVSNPVLPSRILSPLFIKNGREFLLSGLKKVRESLIMGLFEIFREVNRNKFFAFTGV